MKKRERERGRIAKNKIKSYYISKISWNINLVYVRFDDRDDTTKILVTRNLHLYDSEYD